MVSIIIGPKSKRRMGPNMKAILEAHALKVKVFFCRKQGGYKVLFGSSEV